MLLNLGFCFSRCHSAEIKTKIKNEYTTVKEFVDDLELLLNNARTYCEANKDDITLRPLLTAVKNVSRVIHSQLKQCDLEVEEPPQTNRDDKKKSNGNNSKEEEEKKKKKDTNSDNNDHLSNTHNHRKNRNSTSIEINDNAVKECRTYESRRDRSSRRRTTL